MPRRIVTVDGKTFRIADYDLKPLEAGEIRVTLTFAAPKHGTELHSLGGSVFDRKRWDGELRMFLPKPDDAPPPAAPAERGIGNMVVGTVSEVGPEVTRWQVGDSVFGYGQVREIVQGPESSWYPLGDLTPESAVCIDPAHVAFVAVRDGNIRIGDTVAIYGLGAIGLCAVQIARAGGARQVFAVDPLAIRREYAVAHGADAAFDPTAVDAGLQIKLATGKAGVDVSIETSGNARALQDAIRCIRQCGTVVHVPWGPRDCTHLHLDEEFHINRPTLIGSQAWAGWGNPDRDYPLWNWDRAYDATIELFRAGLVTGEGMVTPIASFADAPQMLADAFAHPETAIKAGIRFSS
ncbi:MAG: zinc-binding alcohol dehydrogenase [Capsulimonadales bacterium]|nr:zinc-binding alcohol dehydrogenase [Capsulimonadales bacterium]